MSTISIELTPEQHKAIIHLVHGTILDLQNMPSDEIDPLCLPLLKAIHSKYFATFANTSLLEDLVSSTH